MVCQIAKLKGHKVIASAGGPEKTAFVRNELGADETIDYKAVPDLTGAVARAAPEGIDVYFDNVGGDHLDAALANAKTFGRFALCGMISEYNVASPQNGPRNLVLAVTKSLRLQGFVVLNHLICNPPLQKTWRLGMRQARSNGAKLFSMASNRHRMLSLDSSKEKTLEKCWSS